MSTQDRPLNENALRQLIRLGIPYYRETDHAEHEHPERNISPDDVLFGLERDDWLLVGEPNRDEEHSNWEYLIRTRDIDGDELHVKVAAYPAYRTFKVISRW